MRFTLESFLRKSGTSPVRDYLKHRSLLPGDDFDWTAAPRAITEVLASWIEAFPEKDRDRVFSEFESAQQLHGELGQRCLRAALARNESLLDSLEQIESDQARGLRVLIEAPDSFLRALAIFQADRWRYGRDWSGYVIGRNLSQKGPGEPPADFENEVQEVFRSAFGAGRAIVLEQFERGRLDGRAHILQTTIYAKSNPETMVVFEGTSVDSRVLHPAIEAAITYEPATGQLEVVSGGGEVARRSLARAYARYALDGSDEPQAVELREYSLSKLKRPVRFNTDPEDGIEDVWVTSLRLAGEGVGAPRLTFEVGTRKPCSIWRASRSQFAELDPISGAGWLVRRAEIKILFRRPPEGGRQKSIKVALRLPNGCNLKDHTEKERLIGEKYLAKWGLIRKVA